MARWTFVIAIATVISVVVVAIGPGLVYATLRESRRLTGEAIKATEIQREIIKAGQWVHIDICPIATASAPLEWDGGKLSLRFKINLENAGVGPAINVAARGRDLNEMFGDDSVESIEEIKGTCKAMSDLSGKL